jgi:hypothetical protein
VKSDKVEKIPLSEAVTHILDIREYGEDMPRLQTGNGAKADIGELQ